MCKKNIFLITIISLVFTFVFTSKVINASELYAHATMDNGVEMTNAIYVYDNGKVTFKYKYGLRKAILYYCEKGEQCDKGNYLQKNIMEANIEAPYKNIENDLATYNYNINLESGKEYSILVEAYFSASSYYTGVENVNNWPIRKLQADTGSNYIKISKVSGVSDKRLNSLLDDVKGMCNSIIIPIIFAATTLLLIIKGALLGVQIVKSADNPDIRREKVCALKWLLIGVAITYSATSVVGLVSGFFKDVFNL